MNKKSNELYISDVSEDEKVSREYGDVQALVAGDKEECEHYEKAGNQSKEYYKCCDKEKIKEEKVGNQSKEYYANK